MAVFDIICIVVFDKQICMDKQYLNECLYIIDIKQNIEMDIIEIIIHKNSNYTFSLFYNQIKNIMIWDELKEHEIETYITTHFWTYTVTTIST